jgi:hypothetical protein
MALPEMWREVHFKQNISMILSLSRICQGEINDINNITYENSDNMLVSLLLLYNRYYNIVSNISCRFLCKIKMQYLPISLLVFLYKYTFKVEHFRMSQKYYILTNDQYCIPYFLIKVWYIIERFRVKQHLHTSRREINKMVKLYWITVAKKYGEM